MSMRVVLSDETVVNIPFAVGAEENWIEGKQDFYDKQNNLRAQIYMSELLQFHTCEEHAVVPNEEADRHRDVKYIRQ